MSKLYSLESTSLEELRKEIFSKRLEHDVAIYPFPFEKGDFQSYSIVSGSDRVDKILEEFGAKAVEKGNGLFHRIKVEYENLSREPLWGEKSLAKFLHEPDE